MAREIEPTRADRTPDSTKLNEQDKPMIHLHASNAAAPYAWIDSMQVPNADPYAPRSQRPLSHGDRVERAQLDRATALEMVNAGSMPVSLYVQMFGVDRQETMSARLHVQMLERQEFSCLDQIEH